MIGTRYIAGAGDRKVSLAREILKIEKEKGGKLTNQERFKLIMKRKMDENKKKAGEGKNSKLSKKAQEALKQVAAKKAAKENKIMRQSVIVQKRILTNGMVTKKGQIRDIQGNQIGKINLKNGRMAMYNGANLGQYRPKNGRVDAIISDAINKYSPYYINLRKMQAMQAAGLDPHTGQPINQDVINVHGNRAAMHGAGYNSGPAQQMYEEQQRHLAEEQMRQNNAVFNPNFADPTANRAVSGTAWGAMSNNVWGTHADTVWGTASDNVWGSFSTDIWGGVGGNPWGQGRSVQMWGTGNGVNYLKPLTNMLRKLFGRPNKKTVNAFKQMRSASGAGARKAAAPVRRPAGAPVRRR